MLAGNATESVNVTSLIDEERPGSLLVQVCGLCALVALLDGSNTTSIGVAAPLIAEELALSQAHLGPIFSSATLGAMAGALSFGLMADHFGRKRMLVAATAIFGVFTVATAFADSFGSLVAIRFLAGFGLGGAAPCFVALGSEYAPSSRRALVTGLIWTTFPLGVIIGAVVNAYLLSAYSWHAIFLFGGVLLLVACVALVLWLPESVRFLLLKQPDSPEARRILTRIRPTLKHAERFMTGEKRTEGTPVRNLLSRGNAGDTLLVWVAFMAAFGMTAATFFWSPVLMHNHGKALADASMIVGVGAGFGSLLGAAAAGMLIEKIGPTALLATTFLLATVGVGSLGYVADDPVLIVVANGTLIAGISTAGMLALAAGIYPVAARSTGVGWAMGVGRFGEVLIPLLIAGLLTVFGGLSGKVFLIAVLAPFLGAVSVLVLGRRRRLARLSS